MNHNTSTSQHRYHFVFVQHNSGNMAQPYTGGMTHGQAGFYGGNQQRIFLPRTKLGDMVDK